MYGSVRSELIRAWSQNSTSTAWRPICLSIRRKATFSQSSRGGNSGAVISGSGGIRTTAKFPGLAGEGPEEVRRDVDLDHRGGHEDGESDRRRRDGRGEQLVPLVAPARDGPGGERQEQRHELLHGVGEDPHDQLRGAHPLLAGDRRRVATEHVRLSDEREERGADDERDRERTCLL